MGEGGGEFSRKLKIFKLFAFLWYSMHDLIFKPCEQKHDLSKTTRNMKNIVYINTFNFLESHGKSNLKCYVEEVVKSMKLWI